MPVLSEPKIPVPKNVHPAETDGIILTPDEYIVFERASQEKHDYIYGKAVLRVAGTSPEHNRIQTDFARVLGELLDTAKSACEVFTSDIKVFVTNTLRYYPDASLSDVPLALFDDKDTLHNPLVVIEVLSHSTRAFDKDGKFKNYQKIPSLRHYVLIEQDRVEVTHYEKQSDGSWALAGTYRNLSDDLPLSLPDTQISIPLSRIYRRVSFEADASS